MTKAPALDCAACGHTVGAKAGHALTSDRLVLCGRCLTGWPLHATLWPDCSDLHHDPIDHATSVAGTRAGTAWKLGLWP